MISPADSSSAAPCASSKFSSPDDDTSPVPAAIDNGLVRRFVDGDEGAFVELVARHRSRVLNITLGLLRNRADAEEVTQDAFIRVHRGLADFRGGSSFATWLYRIAVNLAHNRYWYYFRRRRQDSFSLDQPVSAENPSTLADLVPDAASDPAREAVAAEFAALVDQCMERLDARHREILTLRSGGQQSYEEIAAALGINSGTVKSRIARARTNLRALLAEACPEFARGAALNEWFLRSPAIYGRPAAAA